MEITKTALSEQIRERLIGEIMAGVYMPGDKLGESALSKRFKVSQSPVREALKGLEEIGLVTREAYKGTTVRAVSDKDLYEASTVRAALESLAAGIAAEKCTQDDIVRLKAIYAEMLERAEAGDDANRIRLNNEFHDEIIQISGHSLISKLSKILRFASWSRIRGASIKDQAGLQVTLRHQALIDALAAHDSHTAQKLMRKHIEENMSWIPPVQRAQIK